MTGRDFEKLELAAGGEKLLARLQGDNPHAELERAVGNCSALIHWRPMAQTASLYAPDSDRNKDDYIRKFHNSFEQGAAVGLAAVMNSRIPSHLYVPTMEGFRDTPIPSGLQAIQDRRLQISTFEKLARYGHQRHPELDPLKHRLETLIGGPEPVTSLGRTAGHAMGLAIYWVNEAYYDVAHCLSNPPGEGDSPQTDWDSFDWAQVSEPPAEGPAP